MPTIAGHLGVHGPSHRHTLFQHIRPLIQTVVLFMCIKFLEATDSTPTEVLRLVLTAVSYFVLIAVARRVEDWLDQTENSSETGTNQWLAMQCLFTYMLWLLDNVFIVMAYFFSLLVNPYFQAMDDLLQLLVLANAVVLMPLTVGMVVKYVYRANQATAE